VILARPRHLDSQSKRAGDFASGRMSESLRAIAQERRRMEKTRALTRVMAGTGPKISKEGKQP